MDAEYEPPFVHNQQGDRSASIIQIDMGKAVWAVVLAVMLSALSVGLSVHASYTAQQAAMEARINEQTLMELKPRVDLLEKRYAKQ